MYLIASFTVKNISDASTFRSAGPVELRGEGGPGGRRALDTHPYDIGRSVDPIPTVCVWGGY